jgi:transposase
METERIELSARDRERLKVLQQVEEGHLRQVEAAKRLRVSDRQVRRWQQRLRKEGDRGIVHRLRGRRSNRKIPEAMRKGAITELRQARYAGFGPTLASEHLARTCLVASRETLRQWMVAAELWQVRRRQAKRVHVWRPRRCCRGELVMMDSSPFAWLEERGPRCHLIATIDDATSQVWGRLVEHDSTEENLRTVGGWNGQRWGLRREQVRPGLRGARAEIEKRLDGTHWLRFRGVICRCNRARPHLDRPNPKLTAEPNTFRPPSPLAQVLEADISTLRKPDILILRRHIRAAT